MFGSSPSQNNCIMREKIIKKIEDDEERGIWILYVCCMVQQSQGLLDLETNNCRDRYSKSNRTTTTVTSYNNCRGSVFKREMEEDRDGGDGEDSNPKTASPLVRVKAAYIYPLKIKFGSSTVVVWSNSHRDWKIYGEKSKSLYKLSVPMTTAAV